MTDKFIKFGYIQKSEIEKAIEQAQLGAYSVVYTSDTKETIILDANLTPVTIQSRVLTFESRDEANEKINQDSATYKGQLVSVLEGDSYKAYVVNVNDDGEYYVLPMHTSETVDYNQIRNTPITNLNGTSENPVDISTLETGIYLVKGVYITPEGKRVTTLVGHMLAITKEGDSFDSDQFVTESYLKENKYTTESKVEELVDTKLDENLIRISNKEVNDMFE